MALDDIENNGRHDTKLFRPLRIGSGGQIEYVE